MEMKLLIITSIKECQDKVAGIFKETGIEVFSVSEIAGFKEGSSVSLRIAGLEAVEIHTIRSCCSVLPKKKRQKKYWN
jgi:hypothetical protein